MVRAGGVRDAAAVVLRRCAAADADVRRPAGRPSAAGRHQTGVVAAAAGGAGGARVTAGRQRRRGGRPRARRAHHVPGLLQPVEPGRHHRVVRVVQSGRRASGRHCTSGSGGAARGVVELVGVGGRRRGERVLALRRHDAARRRHLVHDARRRRRHLAADVGAAGPRLRLLLLLYVVRDELPVARGSGGARRKLDRARRRSAVAGAGGVVVVRRHTMSGADEWRLGRPMSRRVARMKLVTGVVDVLSLGLLATVHVDQHCVTDAHTPPFNSAIRGTL